MRLNKFIFIFLAAILTCAGFCVYSQENDEKIVDLDFNNFSLRADSSHGFSNITDGAEITPIKLDEEHGNSCAITFTSEAIAQLELPKAINSGVYLFSFEIQKPVWGAYTYIRLISENCVNDDDTANMFETFAMNSAGYIGATEGNKGWNLVPNKNKYKLNTWNKVNMWIDFTNRTITYYLDGEFFTKQPMSKNMNDFKRIDFYLPKINYLDNILIQKVTYDSAIKLKENGYFVPNELLNPVKCTYETGIAGNIFRDKSKVKINNVIENVTADEITLNVKRSIVSYNGNIIDAGEKKLTLKAGEKFEELLIPEPLSYNIYKYKTVCTDVKSNLEYEFTCDFSVVKQPSEGVKNKQFGINTEIMLRNSNQIDNMDVLGTIGLGFFRDGITWNRAETQKGVYGLNEFDENRLYAMADAAKKYNMDFLMLVDGYAQIPGYYTGKNVPQTPEALDALEKMAYNLALKYKGVIKYFEWTNEINVKRYDVMTFEQYAESLKRFYKGIKSGNPDAFVVGVCSGMQDWYFVEDVLKAGGGNYMDAISIHPYAELISPETCDYVELCHSIKRILDKYDFKGELWVTETGMSSTGYYASEYAQAAYLVRQYALNDAFDCADVMMSYAFEVSDSTPTDVESGYGIVRRNAEGCTQYSAKPAYLAVSNYFAMTQNSKYSQNLNEENMYIYRYEYNNGESLIMMSTDLATKNVGLDLGCDKVVLYDMYGNPTEISSVDGKFSFILTDMPVYLKGVFSKFEMCEPSIVFERTEYDVKNGGTVNVSYINNTNLHFILNAKAKDNIDITGISDNSINVKCEDTGVYDFTYAHNGIGTIVNRDIVNVNLTNNGITYGVFPISFNYVEPIYWEFNVYPYTDQNIEHWKGDILIRNIDTNDIISGKVIVNTPEFMTTTVGELEFKDLKPGEEKVLSFNIPSQFTKTWTKYTALAVLNTGETVEMSLGALCGSRTDRPTQRSLETGVIKHIKTEPTIDGILQENEWDGGLQTTFTQGEAASESKKIIVAGMQEDEQTFSDEYTKRNMTDFTGEFYAFWDEEYLYCAARVYDDIQYNVEPPTHWYMADSLFIEIAPTMVQRHVSHYDLALSTYNADIGLHALYKAVERKMPWNGYVNGAVVGVTRENNITSYELKVPWKEIISGDIKYHSSFNFTIGLRDHDKTSDKSFGFSQWKILIDNK